MVMSGVVEEKSSRVVEVLLARMPARNLLAGKIAGIGLLGLGQIVLTALVALVALTATDSADIPAVRASFSRGSSCGSYSATRSTRPCSARSARSPRARRKHRAWRDPSRSYSWRATRLVRRDRQPGHHWAKLVSFFRRPHPSPCPTASRWARRLVGAPLAAELTLAAIAGLVLFGGRVYSGGILHSGPTLTLRAAWRGADTDPGPRMSATGDPHHHPAWPQTPKQEPAVVSTTRSSAARLTAGAVVGVGVALGAAVAGNDK